MNALEKIKQHFTITKKPIDNGFEYEDFGAFLAFSLDGKYAAKFESDFCEATGESKPVDTGSVGVDVASAKIYFGKYIDWLIVNHWGEAETEEKQASVSVAWSCAAINNEAGRLNFTPMHPVGQSVVSVDKAVGV